jgi:pimeloyl-ACP methyl ester carboxylesterase
LFVEIAGMKIHYKEAGTGPDVLLLHGWGASADSWGGVMGALADKCHLVAIDFPGCGKSDLPEKPLDIDDYVSLVTEICQTLNLDNPILIGHSHGCRVMMKICGLGLLSPKKIVMIDGAGLKPKFNLKKTLKIATFKTVKWFLKLPIIRNYSEEALKKARNHFGSADYSTAPEVMRSTMVKLLSHDMTPYIDKIKSSTLLIWGENDTATPLYMAKKLEKNIPDCGLCVIKNTGHWSFVERPIEANAILRSFIP